MAKTREACVKAGDLASTPRLSLGKSTARGSYITLSDLAGKPRLRLTVDSLGAPSVEFLDAADRVTSRLP